MNKYYVNVPLTNFTRTYTYSSFSDVDDKICLIKYTLKRSLRMDDATLYIYRKSRKIFY